MVFDYGFLGGEGDEETAQSSWQETGALECCLRMTLHAKAWLAYMVMEKLGRHEVILKGGNEPAISGAQKEVKRRRFSPEVIAALMAQQSEQFRRLVST
jgi:hypothetical protein